MDAYEHMDKGVVEKWGEFQGASRISRVAS